MPALYAYEVLKTFKFDVEGLSGPVTGEVRKQIWPRDSAQPYIWWISHHYRPSAQAAGIYYPSGISSNSAEDVENSLLVYAMSFTSEFGVEPNQR